MKALAPLAGFSLALALTGLGSGCSSPSTSSYRQPAQQFEVVETSAKRPLTESELAEVQASVGSYLDREGATDSGDYYVKVYLTPENMDADPEWVVVRFTRYTAQRVAVVSAYTYSDPVYAPYYAYDYYPYGYGCVTRLSFQYYVDPFYHQRYYHYPRYGYGGHKGGGHDHDRDNANNHGGGKPGNPPGNAHSPGRPSGPGYAGNRPGTATPPARSLPPMIEPRDGGYRPHRAPRTSPGGTNVAQGDNRGESSPNPAGDVNSGRTSNPGRPQSVPPPPRTTPTRGDANARRPQNYTTNNPAPSVQRPPGQTQQARNRPDGAPTPQRTANPTQAEASRTQARVTPSASRPSPAYRPAQQSQQRSYQPSPQPARTAPPAPERRSPPPSSSGSDNRQGERRDELR